MTEKNQKIEGSDSAQSTPLNRRDLIKGAGGVALGASLPATVRSAFAAGEDVIRVGFISPRSGPIGIFGDGDPYVMDLVRKATANGIEIGGKRYGLQIIDKDTQSNPVRASQIAKDLINGDHVDFVLATSTPETVNPVADTCEAAGVPSLSTSAPWEAFYFGRGAKPGEPSPFKWTYHFCFGVANFATLYKDQWGKLPTNGRVGVMYPNDADGNAIRGLLKPTLEKAGFTIVDPGPYENGTSDYSSQIALLKKEKCEIFNTFPFPPDFAVFWRQAAQKGFAQTVKICQLAKAGLFAPELEALGSLGNGLHAGAYWHPAYPFISPVTGVSCRALADGYEAASGKQWNQQVGATMALFDAGIAAIRASGDPKDKAKLAKAISNLSTITSVGKIDFTKGPVPNCETTRVVGVQWLKAPKGSKFEFKLEVVANADHPEVPITAQMTPYKI